MPSRFSDTALAAARERSVWLVLAAVISTQLLAVYLLCNHQVRRAQERHQAWQAQQVAAADCCAPSASADAPVR